MTREITKAYSNFYFTPNNGINTQSLSGNVVPGGFFHPLSSQFGEIAIVNPTYPSSDGYSATGVDLQCVY